MRVSLGAIKAKISINGWCGPVVFGPVGGRRKNMFIVFFFLLATVATYQSLYYVKL